MQPAAHLEPASAAEDERAQLARTGSTSTAAGLGVALGLVAAGAGGVAYARRRAQA